MHQLNANFHRHFTHKYKSFVLKEKDSSAKDLAAKIESATIQLREENSEEQDVNFSDLVLGDVKRFIGILLFTTIHFYPSLFWKPAHILIKEALQDKLMAYVIKRLLNHNVYKIVLSICRYETNKEEKSFRAQLKRLNALSVTTQDLDINTYFLLNERAGVRERHSKLLGTFEPFEFKKYSLNRLVEEDERSDDENHNIIYEETVQSMTESDKII